MLRIPHTCVSRLQLRLVSAPRLLHSSIVQLNVTNVPPTSVPGSTLTRAPIENPTPVTPSTPNLSTSATSSTVSPPPPPPPKKKTHRFRSFVLLLTVVGAAVYGGGAWYALRNDNFHDFYTEFVPLGERIVMAIEEREFQRRFPNAGRKPLEQDLPRVTVHRGGATWKMVSEGDYKGPATGPHLSAVKAEKGKAEVKTEVVPKPASLLPPAATGTPAPTVTPPAPLVIKEQVMPKLPKVVFEGEIDPALDEVVKAINTVFTIVSKTGEVGPEEMGGLAASLGDVSKKFVSMKETFDKNLLETVEQQMLAAALQAEQATLAHNKKLIELDEKWKEGYFAERQRILETYKRRLTEELSKFSKVYDQRVKNEVTAAVIETEKKLSKSILDKVENERDSRLSQLQDVKSALDDLVAVSNDSEKFIASAEKTAQLQLALGSLANALSTPYTVPLGPYLAKIKELGGEDPLISAALAAVPVSAYDGVLTPAQLAARFKLIAPEIRSVSLVPDGAGVAGFFGSWVLSKLLLKKEGKPQGSDVESVLARAESALMEGQVMEAVAEVNSLDGWRKQLAADWLAEGRKRSEVEFLAQVLGEEGKLWQFEV
ncbi:mitochondrial inner membrane protein-domain-containing protein [Lipomyces arxii]|uniref:mitochondrial inner membrane protein-domain-containing protein n=1 Tax=Lipomyces arxii TaxID=56418 RepID=UPI0034CD4888